MTTIERARHHPHPPSTLEPISRDVEYTLRQHWEASSTVVSCSALELQASRLIHGPIHGDV